MNIWATLAAAFGQAAEDSGGDATLGLGDKAVWTTAAVNALPDSSFLYIETGGDKDDEGKTVPRSLRHFPVRDADGTVDLPHLRNAIARIPQSNAPGLTDAKKAALQNRARRMLEDAQAGTKEATLRETDNTITRAWFEAHPPPKASDGYPISQDVDVYPSYLIIEDSGQALRVPWVQGVDGQVTFGEATPVERVYRPVAAKSQFAVYKQADGTFRWVGWVSNHFRDRDTPPEILSGKAHRAFVKEADDTGRYPELWLWHVPGTKIGKADWLDFSDGFLLASGTFEKEASDVAEKLAGEGDLAMSHGFIRRKHSPDSVVTDSYWMFEASILPRGAEANPWTQFSTIKEEPMNKDKRDYIVGLLGEDRVRVIENDTRAKKALAEMAGVDWKEVEGIEDAQGAGDKAAEDAVVARMADALVERLGLKGLSTAFEGVTAALKSSDERFATLEGRLAALEEGVKSLGKSQDEQVAAALTPRKAEVFSWMAHAASNSKTNAPKEGDEEDQKMVKRAPGLPEVAAQMAAGIRSAVGG